MTTHTIHGGSYTSPDGSAYVVTVVIDTDRLSHLANKARRNMRKGSTGAGKTSVGDGAFTIHLEQTLKAKP